MVTQVDLYRFTEQSSSEVWTFTSADFAVTYDMGEGPEEYIPISIDRSDIEQKNDLSRANLDILVPLDNAAGLRWLRDNGELLVGLTIFQRLKNGTMQVIWKGRLAGTLPGMVNINLKFESIFTSLRRPGLRARYQRSCRHALYGRGCYLNPEDFALAAACTAVTGNVLTCTEAATQPDGYFVGGMLRSPDGVLSYIICHSGTAITIQRVSFSLLNAVGDGFPFSVLLYPGCDHRRGTCNSKFSNGLNYGGFDWIPQKNPTGGSSIV